MMEGTVATQFETITAAARGQDVIVGATAIQVAAPSVAERMGNPIRLRRLLPGGAAVTAPCATRVDHAGDTPAGPMADHWELWIKDARRWNDTWKSLLDSHRASFGLPPVDDVRSHVLTNQPCWPPTRR
jgi:vancomycin aglycone glucosyltransferase